jgi:hypothetical protein
MLPLAHLRQVATCSVYACCAGLALSSAARAADPPSRSIQPPPASLAPSAPPSATVASAPAANSAPAPAEQPEQATRPVHLVPDVAAPLAHSALITVEGTSTADALQLRIRRVADKSLLGGDDVTVAIDGRNQSVTRGKGGLYEVPINDLRGDGARDVDVTVTHDGIREIVSGKVSIAQASSAGSLFRDHKQVAWWILNIVIVLVAAMAFSRRKG